MQHKLATADAIIYATARAHDADVLTCDRHFQGLSGVQYIAKPTA
jgi:predicted nucleic acid-binding protein